VSVHASNAHQLTQPLKLTLTTAGGDAVEVKNFRIINEDGMLLLQSIVE
jgi:hypothetical protein